MSLNIGVAEFDRVAEWKKKKARSESAPFAHLYLC